MTEVTTMRLVGLWTAPVDVEAFEREYLGSHVPKLQHLPKQRAVQTSRCIDGPYFRITEIEFDDIDDIHAALDVAVGQQVLADANALAAKFGVRLEVLVIAPAT
jgi:uncharacterized protein (TIGR02118 family)